MRKLTATLCLTLAVLLGSEVRGSDLPKCEGSPLHTGVVWMLSWQSKTPWDRYAITPSVPWDNCQGIHREFSSDRVLKQVQGPVGHLTLVREYSGQWRNGFPHGHGRHYNARMQTEYVGKFFLGKWHGRGIVTFSDGSQKMGIWKDNKFQYARKLTPTVTARKSPSPYKSVAEKENVRLRKRFACPSGRKLCEISDSAICSGLEYGNKDYFREAKVRGLSCTNNTNKTAPTVTAGKSPPPTKSAAEKENERLRKEIARLKKEKQSRPKQVAKRPPPKSVGMSVSADFQKGLTAYKSGDYATALREWEPLAQQGDADAQFNLGSMFYNGKGVPQDYKTAVKWYGLAAEQGDADAQGNLGAMYAFGTGVLKDYVHAYMWGMIAASKGNGRGGKLRDLAAKEMTPTDISAAKKLARECVLKKYKGC